MRNRCQFPSTGRGLRFVLLCVGLLVSSGAALAVPGTLRTTDGRTIKGDIAIEAGGVKLTLPTRKVENFDWSQVALLQSETEKHPRPEVGLTRTNALPTRRGVLLWDGSFLTWNVRGSNERGVRLGGPKDIEVPWTQVARIHFRDLTPEMLARLPAKRSGALVREQEFVEGEIKSVSEHRVTISSVLFGLRNLENDQRAAAVVLREVTPSRSRYEISLRNGSRLRADAFTSEKNALILRDGVLRGLKINLWELQELRLVASPKAR